ncbi:MAG TPA: pseudouridine synthase [Candidatus Polarisedimenticolaceae bacterium]|nr:pseudouridine synthase [Candidatus Polarisedimenticolaceae bacterium]
MRLNKALAHAGLASRRGADRLIAEGRVTVNGETVADLGRQVDPLHDAIKVDGRRLPAPPPAHTYLALHKPRGYMTTRSDPENRPTVMQLVSGVKARVYPVGRLDFLTEGLLLLTDDGQLARDLTHPASEVPKTYRAKVHGRPEAAELDRLRRGIRLDGDLTTPAKVQLTKGGPNSWVEIVITEGRKHQVRRMLAAVGHPVLKLKRTRFDGIDLGSLPVGASRPLSPAEIERLRRSAGGKAGPRADRRN